MSGLIEVIDGGLGNAIQDAGRFGYRHQGLAVSGFLDRPLADCANALAGNPPATACIEMRGLGPTLAVRSGPLRVALAGNVAATILRANGSSQALPAWQSATLEDHDSLKVGAVAGVPLTLLSSAAAPFPVSSAAAQPTSVQVSVASTATQCRRVTVFPAHSWANAIFVKLEVSPLIMSMARSASCLVRRPITSLAGLSRPF